ncbi:hypothetical protein PoB_002930900 [Plakobranchus ocellatus]|uniref:Uncharacterized protein n=1 Tax=Plakobranchus ocellatus TaxID=259542 RepID=A0AAV4A9A0_9GAST|nr:hypothetical protein PoB_002930900 [Plakobranchus ocellatus]
MTVRTSSSSQPSHTITGSMFPWGDGRGDGRPTDNTMLNTQAPVLVAHGSRTPVRQSFLASDQAGQNLIHPGIIIGE